MIEVLRLVKEGLKCHVAGWRWGRKVADKGCGGGSLVCLVPRVK